MADNLLIVESPAKVKTISGFLGKDFIVKSCNGHIRDLPKDDIGVDVEKNFEPLYIIYPEKKNIVSELKKIASSSKFVWLATDEDREGEAISWHLKHALNLEESKIKRIKFNEISKTAIDKAISKPGKIDQNLVDSQQARRILDRLVGFELSPVLWQKIKRGLSAGRVQSVATKLIVEREKEILKFIPKIDYPVNAIFFKEKDEKRTFKSTLNKKYLLDDDVEDFLSNCKDAKFILSDIEKKEGKRTPPAPFTTATLQQDASLKLGFSVQRTMSVAQKLYENGKITYMRTDAVRLSDDAMEAAKKSITKKFGKEYYEKREFKNKHKGAQEAHEAIRPVDFNLDEEGENLDEKKLYSLIWKRTLASQMANAKLENTTFTIDISFDDKLKFISKGQVIVFDGFLKLYMESSLEDENEDDDQKILPPLKKGDVLKYENIFSKQTFSKPLPRYSEATLVKALESNGIGRPSTYVPIITTIQKREYVIKQDAPMKEREFMLFTLKKDKIAKTFHKETVGGEKNKLMPTQMGITVNDFLDSNFETIMKYEFTANIEEELDKVADGKRGWQDMLKGFYNSFNKNIDSVIQNSERIKIEKKLGDHPDTGEPIYSKVGRFGPYIQIGETLEAKDKEDPSKTKPIFIKIPKNLINTINLKDALELIANNNQLIGTDPKTGKKLYLKIGDSGFFLQLVKPNSKDKPVSSSIPSDIDVKKLTVEDGLKFFEFPKVIGKYEDKEVEVNLGRFGPYVKHDSKFYSLPKDLPITDVTLEGAKDIIDKKNKNDAEKYLYQFDDGLKVAYGIKSPYMIYKRKIYRLPKTLNIEKMNHDDFIALIPNYKVLKKK